MNTIFSMDRSFGLIIEYKCEKASHFSKYGGKVNLKKWFEGNFSCTKKKNSEGNFLENSTNTTQQNWKFKASHVKYTKKYKNFIKDNKYEAKKQ